MISRMLRSVLTITLIILILPIFVLSVTDSMKTEKERKGDHP